MSAALVKLIACFIQLLLALAVLVAGGSSLVAGFMIGLAVANLIDVVVVAGD